MTEREAQEAKLMCEAIDSLGALVESEGTWRYHVRTAHQDAKRSACQVGSSVSHASPVYSRLGGKRRPSRPSSVQTTRGNAFWPLAKKSTTSLFPSLTLSTWVTT